MCSLKLAKLGETLILIDWNRDDFFRKLENDLPFSLLQLGRGENNFTKIFEKLAVKVFAFIKIASCRLLYRYYSLGYMKRLSIF